MKDLTEAMQLRRESIRLMRKAVDLEIRARAKENQARIKRDRRDGLAQPIALVISGEGGAGHATSLLAAAIRASASRVTD